MSDIVKENEKLEELVRINRDACHFYQSAAEKAESSQLSQTFRELDILHNGVAAKIAQYVLQNWG